MFLSTNSNYPIGLDISDLSLKVVQLNKIRDRIKIQALGSKNLPEGLIINGEIKDKKQLVKYINELLDRPNSGKITSREVITCLPETRTFIKYINIEKGLNAIGDMIIGEMEKHIPLSLDEIYFDWQVVGQKGTSYDILLGASPKNIVNQYIEVMNDASLTTLALEVEPISICRSLLKEENSNYKINQNKNYCIFDFGASRSSMIIYARNTILFTVSMPICGYEINQKISQTLQIDYDQAEKTKIVCGLDKNDANGVVNKILSFEINQLINKIKKTLEFYNSNFINYGPINQILLSGGGANIKRLDSVIFEAIGIETIIGNSLTHINMKDKDYQNIAKENIDKKNKLFFNSQVGNTNIANINPDYATAMGLALRGIFIE